MKKLNFFTALMFGVLGLTLTQCNSAPKVAESEQKDAYDLALNQHLELFERLPEKAENIANTYSEEKVKLGHMLYFDKRLSLTGNNSCNSCHNLATFGVDNLPTSPGDNGGFGDRNSPTTLNAALHSDQFWDSRAKDVEEQAGMPILNPVEMAIPSKDFLVERLRGIETYQTAFADAFPESEQAITYPHIEQALALFERELLTPSRFDDYIAGDYDALTQQEKKGMMSFVLTGCTQCHSGVLLGGNGLQKFGVYDDYWKHTGSEHIDKGRMAVTGKESDKYLFKTPSLRNVGKTGPYFHDGSVSELDSVVSIMARIQLNKNLTPDEVENITAFLHALTGDIPADFKTAPEEIAGNAL